MHQNTAFYLAGLAPFKNHCTSAHLPLLWRLRLFGLCVVSKCQAAFSRVVLGICPWCSSACVVATTSPVASPSLRACQHRNWAGFPAAFQPIQRFEGVREPVSSMCLSPCQSKPWGQGGSRHASSIHTSALGLHTSTAAAGTVCTRKETR